MSTTIQAGSPVRIAALQIISAAFSSPNGGDRTLSFLGVEYPNKAARDALSTGVITLGVGAAFATAVAVKIPSRAWKAVGDYIGKMFPDPAQRASLEQNALQEISRLGVDLAGDDALGFKDGKAYFIREAGTRDGRLHMVSRGVYQAFIAQQRETGTPLLDVTATGDRAVAFRSVSGRLEASADGRPSVEVFNLGEGGVVTEERRWHSGGVASDSPPVAPAFAVA